MAAPLSQAAFLSQPSLRWSINLAGERSVRQGNAVVVSRDGSRVFVTAQDGSLHILQVRALSRSLVFEPSNASSSSSGSTTSCSSGVALYETSQGVQFAAYAVTDTAASSGIQSSRVLAVNASSGEELWTVTVDGAVAGTPWINADGSRIYVTHNEPPSSQTTSSAYTGSTVGSISVIGSGQLITTLQSPDNVTSLGPFTPVTGTTVSLGGTLMDVVALAETRDPSTRVASTVGGVYVLMQQQSTGNPYQLRLVSNATHTASAAPALSSLGTSLYVGQDQATVTGWDKTNDITAVLFAGRQDVPPRWNVTVGSSASAGAYKSFV